MRAVQTLHSTFIFFLSQKYAFELPNRQNSWHIPLPHFVVGNSLNQKYGQHRFCSDFPCLSNTCPTFKNDKYALTTFMITY